MEIKVFNKNELKKILNQIDNNNAVIIKLDEGEDDESNREKQFRD